MIFDPYKIRTDFPILNTKMNGKPLVFLDSTSSSQKPFPVIDALDRYYKEENANIHRGVYYLSQRATELYERTRLKISEFLNAKCAKVIIFTRNTTESINLVAQAWGRENISRGDEIVLNELEHHSNLVPWQMLAKEKNAILKFIPLLPDSTLDYSTLNEVITHRTKLVAVSQMSNVTGTIHNLPTIIEKAHSVGAKVLVDGAQGACHIKTDVKKLDMDFYAFSAHKMLGPTGVGVLYGKEEILERMSPWMGGGDMIMDVNKESSTYADLPAKLEAGTPHISGVIAFYEALCYLEAVGLENICKHESYLLKYAIEKLHDFGGVELYGTEELQNRGGVLSFNMDGIHAHDVGSILDENGIAIRVGHHCCQPFMKKMKIAGTARASFYLYNTKEDVDALVDGLRKVKEIFGRVIKR
jgi:cysteine desulfurase / selenocysteine lyase